MIRESWPGSIDLCQCANAVESYWSLFMPVFTFLASFAANI